MPFAVVLYMDAESDRTVREIRRALDERNIQSLGAQPNSDYHPHVSLVAFADGDIPAVAASLRQVVDTVGGISLRLEHLGFFLTEEAPAFLGVTPSDRLLALHRTVAETLQPIVEGFGDYYEPDALLPHCTLAMGVPDRATVLEVLSRFSLPIVAMASAMHIIELPGGLSRAVVAER